MKGRITVPERAIVKEFMFNPNKITDDKQLDWGSLKIPGASHPTYQSGAGGDRVISFTVYLDGDRGKYVKGQEPADLSIQSELNFYRSLMYPGDAKLADMKSTFPYMVLFTFGTMWDALPCIVTAVPIEVTAFDRALRPLRATIDVTLKEFPGKTVTASEVYPA